MTEAVSTRSVARAPPGVAASGSPTTRLALRCRHTRRLGNRGRAGEPEALLTFPIAGRSGRHAPGTQRFLSMTAAAGLNRREQEIPAWPYPEIIKKSGRQ